MKDLANPKIYLVTPPEPDLSGRFPNQLIGLLEKYDVSCLRLHLSTEEELVLGKISDTLREICHNYDVAVIIERHMKLAQKFGLDGVHLNDGAKNVVRARKLLGKEAIVGAFCGVSRHSGIMAAEAGADYISFGPVNRTNLGDEALAKADLFEWWSQMIEVPVVAEGHFDTTFPTIIGKHADFLAFGQEFWKSDDPSVNIEALITAHNS